MYAWSMHACIFARHVQHVFSLFGWCCTKFSPDLVFALPNLVPSSVFGYTVMCKAAVYIFFCNVALPY